MRLDRNSGADRSNTSNLKKLYDFLKKGNTNDFYLQRAEWICNEMDVNALQEEYDAIVGDERLRRAFASLINELKGHIALIKDLGYVTQDA